MQFEGLAEGQYMNLFFDSPLNPIMDLVIRRNLTSLILSTEDYIIENLVRSWFKHLFTGLVFDKQSFFSLNETSPQHLINFKISMILGRNILKIYPSLNDSLSQHL